MLIIFRQILICTSLSILRRIYSYQHFIHLMSTRPNILPNPIEATRNVSIIFRCLSHTSDNRPGEERRIKAIAPYIKDAAFASCTCKNGATKEATATLAAQSDSVEKTAGQKKATSAFAAIKTAGQKRNKRQQNERGRDTARKIKYSPTRFMLAAAHTEHE